MSKLDFPTSPALNQIFTQNGKSWIWDGTSWKNYNTATIDKGGTGLTGIGATDAFLSSNSAGTALTYRKFTAVSGILITVEPSEVKFNVLSQAFSGSGTVDFGNQYEIPYYSQLGSGILITGSPNFVNVGTGISILYNTVSNSTSTGALVVNGGVGIGGSLFVGDSSNIDGLLIENSTVKSGNWAGNSITAFYGGTGLKTFSDGDILVGLGGTWYNLPKSNNAGEVLTISASSPYLSWQAVQAGSAASSVNIGLDNENAERYIIFADSNGSGIYLSSDSGIRYNPFSNILSVGGISITTGTNSSSTSSGALIIDGGIGITGNAFIGGTITASTFTGNVSATAVTSTNFYGNLTGTATTATYSHQSGYAITAGNSSTATTAANLNIVSTNTGTFYPLFTSVSATASGVAVSVDSNLSYDASTDTLTAGKFSGLASGTAATFTNFYGTLTGNVTGTATSSRNIFVVDGSSDTRNHYLLLSPSQNGSGVAVSTESTLYIVPSTNTLFLSSGSLFAGTSISTPIIDSSNRITLQTSIGQTDAIRILAGNSGASGTFVAFDTFNKRVGLGISTPVYTLDVVGDINASSGQSFRIGGNIVLNSTTLGSNVVNSSLTSLGTISTGVWAGTAITAHYGGTGLQTPFAIGDLLYANSTTTWARLAASTSGSVLASQGANVAPQYVAQSTLSVGSATTATNTNLVLSTVATGNHPITFTPSTTTVSGGAQSFSTAIYAIPSGGIIVATGFTGGLTGNVVGNVTGTATTTRNIILQNATTDSSHLIAFTPSSSSSGSAISTESRFVYNPSTGLLSISGLAVTSNTNSTSTTTGALTVMGGVGIGGSVYVGGNIDVGTGYSFRINSVSVLNSTTLGSSVVNSSLTSLGIVTSGTWAATAITSAYGGIGAKPIVSKGDILVGSGNTWYNLPYSGSDNQVLTIDTAQPFGVKWAAVPPAAASSVAVKSTDEAGTRYLTFVSSSDSSGLALSTDTNLVYEADSNRLTVGVLAGNGVTIGSASNTISASNDLVLTSNTNNVVVNNNLSVTGNLIVNGTTTSIGSTITTLLDPIFVLGAGIGGTNPTTDDNKDRGIEFRYYSGIAKTGFFGYDDSTGYFTFIPDGLNENEIFSGVAGTAQFTTVIGNLSGFADTSNNIRVQTTSNSGYHPLLFTPSVNASGSAISSNSAIVYEPSTNILTVSGLSVTSLVESSSTTTGSLKVSGGVGIIGNAFIGGTVTAPLFTGNLSATAVTATNFYGTLTGNVTGTATSSTNIFSVDGSGDTRNHYLLLSPSQSGSGVAVSTDSILYIVPSTNTLFLNSGSLFAGTSISTPIIDSSNKITLQTSIGQTDAIRILAGNSGASGTFVAFDTFNKRIGVGISTPVYTLDIVGNINASAGQSYRIGGVVVLNSTTLGSSVVNSSLTSLGTITTGVWSGSTITSFYGGTGYATYSTGDLLAGAGSTLLKIAVGTNNFVLMADSTVPGGVKWANVSGIAITNINGLTSSKQDLAFGYSGTVPAFSSSGATHTLNIPLAGTGSTGLVSTQSQSFAGIKTFTNAVNITDTTVSTSTSTGALIVNGGVGIGGSLFLTSSLPSSLSGVVVNNGVVTSGSWAGSTITMSYGGTGYASNSKGDILVGTGESWYKLAYSANANDVLTVDATTASGLKWAAVPPASASSVAVQATDDAGTRYLTFVNASTGSGLYLSTDTSLSYEASTNTLTTGTFVGNLTGTATTSNNLSIVSASSGTTHAILFTPSYSTAGSAISANGTLVYDVSIDRLYSSGISITASTGSTNQTTGALIVNGGVGVAGTIVANDFYVTANITGAATNGRWRLSTGSTPELTFIAPTGNQTNAQIRLSNNFNSATNQWGALEFRSDSSISPTVNGIAFGFAERRGSSSGNGVTTLGLFVSDGTNFKLRLSIPGGIAIGNTNVVVFGASTSTTPATTIIRAENAYGTDIDAQEFRLSAGRSTGTGAVPGITFYVSSPSTTGSALNTENLIARFTGTGISVLSTTSSTGTNNGAVSIAGGLGLAGNAFIGGTVSITSNTQSTSSTSGALVVNGGAGLGGSLFVAGNINVNSGYELRYFASDNTNYAGFKYTGATQKTYTLPVDTPAAGTANSALVSNDSGVLSWAPMTAAGAAIGYTVFSGNNFELAYYFQNGTGVTGAQNIHNVGTGMSLLYGTNSSSTSTGALVIRGGLGITGNAFIGGTITASTYIGNVSGTAATITNIYGTLTGTATTSTNINSTSTTSNTRDHYLLFSPTNGGSGVAVSSGTGLSFNPATTLLGVQKLSVFDTTNSTSSSTGALVVSGGVGVGGTIFTSGLNIQDILTLGSQIFYPQNTRGFSVNENFNPVGSGASHTAYHFTSGVGRTAIYFDLAITNQYTVMFGTYGSSAGNTFVIGSETANSDFEFRRSLGIQPVRLDLGTLLMRIKRDGNVEIPSSSSSTSTTTGALTVTGGFGLAGNAFIGGTVLITNTTNSSSINSGALEVDGGVGVGQSISIGGRLQIFNGTNAGYAAFRYTGAGNTVYTLPNNAPVGTAASFLSSDINGNLNWIAPPSAGSGNPGGSDTQIQFNDGGSFGGATGFTYNKITNLVSIASSSYDSIEGEREVVLRLYNSDSASGAFVGPMEVGAGSAISRFSPGLQFRSEGKETAGAADNTYHSFKIFADARVGSSASISSLRFKHNLQVQSTGFQEPANSSYKDILLLNNAYGVGIAGTGATNVSYFRASNSQSTTLTYVLPTAYPATGTSVLSSDTTGTLSWVASGAASPGGSGTVNSGTAGSIAVYTDSTAVSAFSNITIFSGSGVSVNSNLNVRAGNQLRISNSGNNYTAIVANNSIGSNFTLTLPSAQNSSIGASYLTVDTSGNMFYQPAVRRRFHRIQFGAALNPVAGSDNAEFEIPFVQGGNGFTSITYRMIRLHTRVGTAAAVGSSFRVEKYAWRNGLGVTAFNTDSGVFIGSTTNILTSPVIIQGADTYEVESTNFAGTHITAVSGDKLRLNWLQASNTQYSFSISLFMEEDIN